MSDLIVIPMLTESITPNGMLSCHGLYLLKIKLGNRRKWGTLTENMDNPLKIRQLGSISLIPRPHILRWKWGLVVFERFWGLGNIEDQLTSHVIVM